jgi:Shikimate kinase
MTLGGTRGPTPSSFAASAEVGVPMVAVSVSPQGPRNGLCTAMSSSVPVARLKPTVQSSAIPGPAEPISSFADRGRRRLHQRPAHRGRVDRDRNQQGQHRGVEATEDHRSLTVIRPKGRFHHCVASPYGMLDIVQHYHYRVGEGMGPPIVVMGVSGSGKSTIGAALAQRLRVPFADADDFHPPANVAKMTAGHALDDNDRFPWLESIRARRSCGTFRPPESCWRRSTGNLRMC